MTALRIGDSPLTPADVVAAARGGAIATELTPAARERIARSQREAVEVAGRRQVYGRTTGVGANRDVVAEQDDLQWHSVRLLRSHVGGAGDPLPDELVRGMLLIRLAQMAAGVGGHRLELVDAVAGLLRDGPLPLLHDLGGIGTGDLTLLAQVGIALADADRLGIEAGDALAFMSSNAATHAAAALAWSDTVELLDAGLGISALTFHALDGNPEAFAAAVAAARPLPGLVAASERLRALSAGAGTPARLQDPFGLRCLPPVAGALHDAAATLHDVLAVEINAGAENPLFADGDALHNGGFHAAPVALALDTLRLALVPFASMSGARLAHLMEPRLSGLTPFLSGDAPGSSGLLIAEYMAADALARIRGDAAPAVLGGVVISRGLEEHASFAWQSAAQARRALPQLRAMLALEWVAAERALRMKRVQATGPIAPLRALGSGFDDDLKDRSLGPDVALAEAALPALARAVREA
jgi:histidine ammonia-lyase